MFFENGEMTFRVIDVLRIEQRNVRKMNSNRHFSALSFREQSDAVIAYSQGRIQMKPGAVTFFPADVDYERAASVDQMTVVHFELLNCAAREIESFVTGQPQRLAALFAEIYAEWLRNRPDRQYRVNALFYALFTEIYGECSERLVRRSPLMSRALKYIDAHFAQPELTVARLAREVGVCEVYLRRIFRQEMGESPRRYINSMRLRHAASLITSGYYSVGEAARQAGYTDEKYFSVAFRRAMGCSPSQYSYQYKE